MTNRNKAIAIVLIFGFLLFYFGTDGFQAFTAESARTKQLTEDRPVFPNVTLQDSKNRTYAFDAFAGKYVLVTFIYTACTDVCPQLEMNMADIYNRIPQKFIGNDIVFLSISFDPDRDDPITLERYRNYFGSDGETWRMARIKKQAELRELLDAFNIIVIPDGNGNFTHNTAFYLVDPTGRLMDVMDYQDIEGAAQQIQNILKAGK